MQGVAEASASQKRAVRELVSVLQAFRQFDTIRRHLQSLRPDITSRVLRDVVEGLPCVAEHVQELERLFDLDLAGSDSIALHEGHDPEYDSALRLKREVEQTLHQFLSKQKSALNCPKLKFSGSGTVESI